MSLRDLIKMVDKVEVGLFYCDGTEVDYKNYYRVIIQPNSKVTFKIGKLRKKSKYGIIVGFIAKNICFYQYGKVPMREFDSFTIDIDSYE